MVLSVQKLQYAIPKMPVHGRAFAKPIYWLFYILQTTCHVLCACFGRAI